MKRSTFAPLALASLGFLIPALAARAAQRVADGSFHAITKRPPPGNPAAQGVTWKHALLWTALSGVIGGLMRMITWKALTRTGVPAESYDLSRFLRSLFSRRLFKRHA